MFFETVILKILNIWLIRIVCFLSSTPIHESKPVFLNIFYRFCVLHGWLTAKNCLKFTLISINSNHFCEAVGSITKSAAKEKPLICFTILFVDRVNDFTNVAISSRRDKKIRSEFTNSLLTSSSDADAVVALSGGSSYEVYHVNFVWIVVDTRCHDDYWFLILGRISCLITIGCVGPIKSYGSSIFVHELFSNVLWHVLFLVSVHILLKYIQQNNLKRWPRAQIIQFDFEFL